MNEQEDEQQEPLKEYELLAKALNRIKPLIDYHENEIEIRDARNPKVSRKIQIPKEYLPIIKRVFNSAESIKNEESAKVFLYIFEIINATGVLDLIASTPQERKLKIAVAKQLLKDKISKEIKEGVES